MTRWLIWNALTLSLSILIGSLVGVAEEARLKIRVLLIGEMFVALLPSQVPQLCRRYLSRWFALFDGWRRDGDCSIARRLRWRGPLCRRRRLGHIHCGCIQYRRGVFSREGRLLTRRLCRIRRGEKYKTRYGKRTYNSGDACHVDENRRKDIHQQTNACRPPRLQCDVVDICSRICLFVSLPRERHIYVQKMARIILNKFLIRSDGFTRLSANRTKAAARHRTGNCRCDAAAVVRNGPGQA
jgi:hypothetical protein